jgi:hypothetical protein
MVLTPDGLHRCVPGDMPLSRNLDEGLREVFLRRSRPPARRSVISSGAWFCPGDGSKMTKTVDGMICPRCRISIDEFLYELIELHPHR